MSFIAAHKSEQEVTIDFPATIEKVPFQVHSDGIVHSSSRCARLLIDNGWQVTAVEGLPVHERFADVLSQALVNATTAAPTQQRHNARTVAITYIRPCITLKDAGLCRGWASPLFTFAHHPSLLMPPIWLA